LLTVKTHMAQGDDPLIKESYRHHKCICADGSHKYPLAQMAPHTTGNPSLPCVKIFAARFLSGARQRLLCRAFYTGRTTNKKRTVKNSLPCVFCGTHGKPLSSPCVFSIVHGKLFFLPTPVNTEGETDFFVPFAVRLQKNARQRGVFPQFI
jgi:hypothetical protein